MDTKEEISRISLNSNYDLVIKFHKSDNQNPYNLVLLTSTNTGIPAVGTHFSTTTNIEEIKIWAHSQIENIEKNCNLFGNLN